MDRQQLEALAADGFGHWLAGFVDGEGCFQIRTQRKPDKNPSYTCSLVLCVRADDIAILEEIVARTGFGRVDKIRDRRPGVAPQTRWVVARKGEVVQLVELFDRFPLRAKKCRDYAIWREAVLEWHRVCRGRGHRPGAEGWSRVRALREQLHAVRIYA